MDNYKVTFKIYETLEDYQRESRNNTTYSLGLASKYTMHIAILSVNSGEGISHDVEVLRQDAEIGNFRVTLHDVVRL